MGLHYKLTGQQPDKPYVTLIHGLFGNLDNLSSLARSLAEQFNVLSVDLPDHGKSPRSEVFSFEQYAQQFVALFKELNIERSHFVGHSLGGKVSMQIALQYPQICQRLVVADIAPVAYHSRHDNVFKGLHAVEVDSLTERRDADARMAKYVDEPGVRQFLLKGLYREEERWQWRFNLELLQRDYLAVLGEISAANTFDGSTLFIKGELSDYVLAEHRDAILALFPNSQAKVIQGTGHWLHAEKPAIFNRIVGQFLSAS